MHLLIIARRHRFDLSATKNVKLGRRIQSSLGANRRLDALAYVVLMVVFRKLNHVHHALSLLRPKANAASTVHRRTGTLLVERRDKLRLRKWFALAG